MVLFPPTKSKLAILEVYCALPRRPGPTIDFSTTSQINISSETSWKCFSPYLPLMRPHNFKILFRCLSRKRLKVVCWRAREASVYQERSRGWAVSTRVSDKVGFWSVLATDCLLKEKLFDAKSRSADGGRRSQSPPSCVKQVGVVLYDCLFVCLNWFFGCSICFQTCTKQVGVDKQIIQIIESDILPHYWNKFMTMQRCRNTN